jgi:predicted alpha/beta superfamily hydrolase
VPDDESVLADTEAHLLVSSYVLDTFKIFVGYPAAAPDDEFAEVVYLSDANGHFGSAVDTLWGLVRAGHVPPTLIIVLGYQAARLRQGDPQSLLCWS